MEKELSPDDLVRQAEALYLDAAMLMTHLEARMKRAVRLVILHKMPAAKAAKRVGRHRNNVYRALALVKPKLEQVKQEAAP